MNLFVFLLLIAMTLIIAALFSKISKTFTTNEDYTFELLALVAVVFMYGMIFQAFYGPSNPCP